MEKETKYLIRKKINYKIHRFLLKSSGTKRSMKSFNANNIIFAICLRKQKIIGCIPLEKRQLKSKSKSIICYFITNAFIHKDYQNISIGSHLLNLISKKIKSPILSFRKFSNDQASSWYKKNKFHNIKKIECFEKKFTGKKKLIRSNEFSQISLKKKNYKKIFKIIKNRKGIFDNNYSFIKRLYLNNYYEKYFKKTKIFFKKRQTKFYFITLTWTNVGDNLYRYEIIDSNLNTIHYQKFFDFFKNNLYKKNNISLRIKTFLNSKIVKILKKNKFLLKKHQTNLLSNYNLKSIKIEDFNTIEYV